MTTAAEVIRIAYAQVGVRESPSGSNNVRYGVWSGFNMQPWCGSYVSWCFSYAGQPLPNIDFPHGFVGCRDAVTYAKTHGLWSESGHYAPGDIALYCWNGTGIAEHTGIIVHDDGHVMTVLEGNTSIHGSQSNGGEVCLQYRLHGTMVLGVFRASKLLNTTPTPPLIPPPYVGSLITNVETSMVSVPIIQLGSDDAHLPGSPVANVQRQLAAHGVKYGGHAVTVDGQAGPTTIGALKSFQKAYGLPQTGQTDGPTLATLMRA